MLALALTAAVAGVRVPAAATTSVSSSTVCFAVHDGPLATRVIGTRFQAAGSDRRRVILLVYGHSGTRRIWDWKPTYSVARRLARAGFLVLTYDRLSAGDSRVSRALLGNAVSYDADREMIAEIVEQIRGTYPLPTRAPAGPCTLPGAGAAPHPRVILVGHSLGGALVGSYPGAYQSVAPVDAIVQADYSNIGASDEATALIDAKATTPDNVAAGYVSLFLDDGSTPATKTVSPTTCAQNRQLVLAHDSSNRTDAVTAACDPTEFDPVPYGDFISAAANNQEDISLIAHTPPTLPVLLVFGADDCFFPPAASAANPHPCPSHATGGGCDARGCQQDEIGTWQTICPCARDVSVWEQPDAGHVLPWTATMPLFTRTVTNWLARHRL
jgi:pimeloyl-ACP methyl ester carboxylesterase